MPRKHGLSEPSLPSEHEPLDTQQVVIAGKGCLGDLDRFQRTDIVATGVVVLRQRSMELRRIRCQRLGPVERVPCHLPALRRCTATHELRPCVGLRQLEPGLEKVGVELDRAGETDDGILERLVQAGEVGFVGFETLGGAWLCCIPLRHVQRKAQLVDYVARDLRLKRNCRQGPV